MDTFVSGSKRQWEELKKDTQGLGGTWDKFADNSKTMWAELKSDVATAGTGIGATFNTLKIHAAGFGLVWFAGLAVAKSGLDTFVSGSKSQWEQLKTDLAGVGTAFETFKKGSVAQWQALKTEIKAIDWFGLGMGIIGGIKSGIETVTATLELTWRSMVDGWVNIVLKPAKSWLFAGMDIVRAIRDGVVSVAGAMITAFGQMILDAAKKITETDWLTLGKNIVSGLIKGVQAKAGDFLSAIGGLVQDGLDLAKSKLGIESPSKVFMELGRDIVRGWIIGMEQEGPKLLRSVEGLVRNITKAASAAGTGGASSVS